DPRRAENARHPSDPRSRRCLRARSSAAAAVAGGKRGADSAPEPMAKRIRGTPDRIDPTGVPEPFRYPESAPPEKDADRLPVLLPPDADTPGAGQTMSCRSPIVHPGVIMPEWRENGPIHGGHCL